MILDMPISLTGSESPLRTHGLIIAGGPGMDGRNARAPVRCAGTRCLWLPGGLYVALALLFCGCTSPREYVRNGFKVGPNYAKPAAPVEEKWLDAGNKDLV